MSVVFPENMVNHPSHLYLSDRLGLHAAEIAIVLGSGFAHWIHSVDIIHNIPYEEIPGFPRTTVEGHHGRLLLVETAGIRVMVMQGRFHFYEGFTMDALALPIRIFSLLGIKRMIFTNASGGINNSYDPGDLMVIQDHINLVGNNPLIGPNLDDFGPRFPDASNIYDDLYQSVVIKLAPSYGMKAHQGVYVYTSGPSFETPAEIRMMRIIGGDAVGMSTVPEVMVANHCGMRILGLSLIANPAAGMSDHPLTHTVVMDTMEAIAGRVNKLLNAVIAEIGGQRA